MDNSSQGSNSQTRKRKNEPLIKVKGSKNLTFSTMQFEGSKTTIELNDVEDSTFKDLHFRNNSSKGIKDKRGKRNQYDNITGD